MLPRWLPRRIKSVSHRFFIDGAGPSRAPRPTRCFLAVQYPRGGGQDVGDGDTLICIPILEISDANAVSSTNKTNNFNHCGRRNILRTHIIAESPLTVIAEIASGSIREFMTKNEDKRKDKNPISVSAEIFYKAENGFGARGVASLYGREWYNPGLCLSVFGCLCPDGKNRDKENSDCC
jgi:hypothetical protein